MTRPQPPEHLCHAGSWFQSAPDVVEWLTATFLEEQGELFNPDHVHLQSATIGCLWTNVENSRQMKAIAGTAEMPMPRGSKWQVERANQQMREWFGGDVDFLLTFYAPTAAELDDPSFCALVEHELYHCAQALDEFGSPKFTKDGLPKFALKGHDAEEFVGIVKRYGVGAAADGIAQLVEAAKVLPTVRKAAIGRACGTCHLRLA